MIGIDDVWRYQILVRIVPDPYEYVCNEKHDILNSASPLWEKLLQRPHFPILFTLFLKSIYEKNISSLIVLLFPHELKITVPFLFFSFHFLFHKTSISNLRFHRHILERPTQPSHLSFTSFHSYLSFCPPFYISIFSLPDPLNRRRRKRSVT